jgi:serpin B
MATPPAAVWTDPVAVNAINALGIDLLHQTATADANALLSPYSIQMAMALAYAGAEGGTREEMARVLHYPTDEARLTGAFTALQVDLAGIMQRQAVQAELMTRHGIPNDRRILTTANRLFGQTGSDFRPGFWRC